MKKENYKAIAGIINNQRAIIKGEVLDRFDIVFLNKRVDEIAKDLSDYFGKENNIFMPDTSIGLTKEEKKFYLDNMFDRKQFLSDCGVRE